MGSGHARRDHEGCGIGQVAVVCGVVWRFVGCGYFHDRLDLNHRLVKVRGSTTTARTTGGSVAEQPPADAAASRGAQAPTTSPPCRRH